MRTRLGATVAPVMTTVLTTLVAMAIALGGPATSRARAQGTEHAPREAIELYERGRALYAAGRYQEAAEELERALQLDPGAPMLVYNVALVHERLGNLERAIEYYARYLLVLPDDQADERERTEATLRRLRGAYEQQRRRAATERRQRERERIAAAELAREQAMREARDSGAGDRGERRRGRFDLAVIVTGGAAIGLAVGGVVFGVMATSSRSDADAFVVGETGTLAERTEMADAASRNALIADVAFGLSIGAATAATLLYFLRDAPSDETERRPRARAHARASIAPTRGGAAVTIEGSIP